MTKAELDAIRARVEAATPGPWRASRWPSNNPSVSEAWGLSGMVTFADATFCGHAREDTPALLAEVERLTGEVESKTKQNIALVGQNGRLQQEVERSTAALQEATAARSRLAVDFKAMRERSFRDEALRHLASIEWNAMTREGVPYCLFCFKNVNNDHTVDCSVFGRTGCLRPSMRDEDQS